ncbi:MAG TPA: AbrB/MazE/SpoVT family DNA-binding domain-containing protein [Candidatus Acidoferrum sp.]|nr:AbrB/MazE/SpoVT family DNA-binding domain-containing protein [Candidatus Acidoferrum sp.]
MTTRITIDKAGRVVLPKPLRNSLQLAAGDELLVETDGNQITLVPVRPEALLRKKQGIWVYHGDSSNIDIVEFIDQMREERNREVLGEILD